MMITRSRRAEKALKRYHRAGRRDVLDAFENVVDLLERYDQQARVALRDCYRDHALKGYRRGMRELHLAHDDLLLYWIIMDDKTIILENIVTHEELRKRG